MTLPLPRGFEGWHRDRRAHAQAAKRRARNATLRPPKQPATARAGDVPAGVWPSLSPELQRAHEAFTDVGIRKPQLHSQTPGISAAMRKIIKQLEKM